MNFDQICLHWQRTYTDCSLHNNSYLTSRLLKANPRPSAQMIEDHFDQTICRCTGDEEFKRYTPSLSLTLSSLSYTCHLCHVTLSQGNCHLDAPVVTLSVLHKPQLLRVNFSKSPKCRTIL